MSGDSQTHRVHELDTNNGYFEFDTDNGYREFDTHNGYYEVDATGLNNRAHLGRIMGLDEKEQKVLIR
jgi:hypothetical protein